MNRPLEALILAGDGMLLARDFAGVSKLLERLEQAVVQSDAATLLAAQSAVERWRADARLNRDGYQQQLLDSSSKRAGLRAYSRTATSA